MLKYKLTNLTPRLSEKKSIDLLMYIEENYKNDQDLIYLINIIHQNSIQNISK